MTKTKLTELLESCTKAEFIEVILRASELASSTFPWKQIVAIIKTKMIKRKTDEKLDELEVLKKKFEAIPEEKKL